MAVPTLTRAPQPWRNGHVAVRTGAVTRETHEHPRPPWHRRGRIPGGLPLLSALHRTRFPGGRPAPDAVVSPDRWRGLRAHALPRGVCPSLRDDSGRGTGCRAHAGAGVRLAAGMAVDRDRRNLLRR